MTLHQAIKASPRAQAKRRNKQGLNTVAMLKLCGTYTIGHHEDLRVVVGLDNPTTLRKLTKTELKLTDWHPVPIPEGRLF